MAEPEERTERQEEFLSSWKRSPLGGRPSVGVPLRGLRGIAVMICTVAIVVGVVIGGVAAVNTVAGRDGGTASDAALTSADLATATPEEPQPSATQTPKKTKHRTKTSEPVQTRTVTRTTSPHSASTASPKASPKAKKGEKQTKAEKKKAQAAGAAAEATPGTTLKSVGVIKNLVTGMCVDLPGTGAAGENVLATQYYCEPGSADNQEYETISQADGTFLLRNVKSHWCLDVNGSGSVEPGIVVNTHTCLLGDQDNQMFKKQAQGDGFYLVNVKSGLCLDVSGENGDSAMPDQKLTLFTCSPDDDHIWTFTS